MTQAASFDSVQTPSAPSGKPAGKFRTLLTVFKWELRNCRSPLMIYSILSTVAIVVIFTLCMLFSIGAANEEGFPAEFSDIQTAMLLFQVIASYAVSYLNIIFTVVYTIRIYSYLHNKRKADMYGALPISRRSFYVTKTISAFLFSVIPTMFFISIISIFSFMFTFVVVNEVGMLYLQVLFGSLSCISFYGLLSVCCGTSVNAVLSFVAINFAYPISAMFIKGTLKSFLYGIPTESYNSSFIMSALQPVAAYNGKHLIYWTLFIAACLFLGIFLVKKRKAECAQTSFAYYLPCYVVKLLVAFLAGMFLGVTFASLSNNVNCYLLFCFGFITGSIPAYIITHLILYKGFAKLMKTTIPLGALMLVVIVSMAFLNYDPAGYVTRVPIAESVESAGVIKLSECYQFGRESSASLAAQASDDYTDEASIGTIVDFHRSIVDKSEDKPAQKYQRVWTNMLLSDFYEYIDSGYCVSYRLKDGSTISRVYDDATEYYNVPKDLNELIKSDKYTISYSGVMQVKPDEITDFMIAVPEDGNYYNGTDFDISKNKSVSEAQVNADRMKILEAFREDVKEFGVADVEDDCVCRIELQYSVAEGDSGNVFDRLLSSIVEAGSKTVYVSKDYSRTIRALQETGVLNKMNYGNTRSPYYTLVDEYEDR